MRKGGSSRPKWERYMRGGYRCAGARARAYGRRTSARLRLRCSPPPMTTPLPDSRESLLTGPQFVSRTPCLPQSAPPAAARSVLLLQRLHAAVERRAIDSEQLRGLAHVAARELHRGLDVAVFPCLEHAVEVEPALALKVPLRLIHQRV